MALLNGTGFGNSCAVYQENFNSGSSLRDLGFTYFGLHSDGWKLNTADGCLESEPEVWNLKTGLYSPGFEVKRIENAVGLEWAISFKSHRPDHHYKHQQGHYGPFFGMYHPPAHGDWFRVGLADEKARLAYSLKITPEEKKDDTVSLSRGA